MSLWVALKDVTSQPRKQGTCWVEVIKLCKNKTHGGDAVKVVVMNLKKRVFVVHGKDVIEFFPSIPTLTTPTWVPQEDAAARLSDFTVQGLITEYVPSAKSEETRISQKDFQALVHSCVEFVKKVLEFGTHVETVRLVGTVFYYSDAILKSGHMLKRTGDSDKETPLHTVYEIESMITSGHVGVSTTINDYVQSFNGTTGIRLELREGFREWPPKLSQVYANAYIYSDLFKEGPMKRGVEVQSGIGNIKIN